MVNASLWLVKPLTVMSSFVVCVCVHVFQNVDIDECRLGRQDLGHNCPEMSQCINLPGSEGKFDCQCEPGFSMVVGANQIRRCIGKQCWMKYMYQGYPNPLFPPHFYAYMRGPLWWEDLALFPGSPPEYCKWRKAGWGLGARLERTSALHVRL